MMCVFIRWLRGGGFGAVRCGRGEAGLSGLLLLSGGGVRHRLCPEQHSAPLSGQQARMPVLGRHALQGRLHLKIGLKVFTGFPGEPGELI